MMTYYYLDDGNLKGPIPKEEMKWQRLSKETLVWTEGMEDWGKLQDVPGLEEFIPSDEVKDFDDESPVATKMSVNTLIPRVRKQINTLRHFNHRSFHLDNHTLIDLPRQARNSFAKMLMRLSEYIKA